MKHTVDTTKTKLPITMRFGLKFSFTIKFTSAQTFRLLIDSSYSGNNLGMTGAQRSHTNARTHAHAHTLFIMLCQWNEEFELLYHHASPRWVVNINKPVIPSPE